ncbi:MalY/PatB family protein [Denitratisoma oestradiolicum]|uniref:cysteine-S-conjugate beta-lyase n=1 Tax=Denitratisoma oestradiolicum TaxID=311182 RepID=A0A6S6XX01_9PROT|nr:PatB family C-S lyase [Denitratisoma oestradiolicum]TWO80871.1 aspartate aminotransferase [Denitratisoma oestradiolicum]CAB1367369.1 Aspartate aminotransferase [Denitratisoma oestradiolicum]
MNSPAFDFDSAPDRRHGDSLKWNRYDNRDILPLWVADMDFAAPPAVLSALHDRINHGVLGYSQPWPSLTEAVLEYLERNYRWTIRENWLVWLPGLVSGLNLACRAVGRGGDAVCTAAPIYPPFLTAPTHSGRRTLQVPLVREGSRWNWDFDAMEMMLRDSSVRLLLLCHPHNPAGRVWRDEELGRIAELATRYDLVVCSDEIHCDLILDTTLDHHPFVTVAPALAERSITLMAPSKTFNIPGLGCAFAIIPGAKLRHAFKATMQGIMPHVNTLGLVACEAALRNGAPWRQALLDYLRGNAQRVEAAVAGMPGLCMTPVEATYLAWIDCRERGLERPAEFFEAAGVGLSDGTDFGAPGFVRLNFGCPRHTLDTALARMAQALTA